MIEQKSNTRYQIFAIRYRKAPKYPYPIPVMDCVNGLKFLLKNKTQRQKYNISNNFGIFGESAGGNLTAAVLMFLDLEKDFDEKLRCEKANIAIPMMQSYFVGNTPANLNRQCARKEIPGQWLAWAWLCYAGIDPYKEVNRHFVKYLMQSDCATSVPKDLTEHMSSSLKYFSTAEPEKRNAYYRGGNII